MKPILCTSDLRNIHVCFATESSTKCFEHLRSPLKKTRAWLRCKKIENCKVKLEYWNLHPTELLKVEWLLAKMLAIKNARDHFASKIRADLDHGASKMRADHWSRSRSARAMLAINVHMILSPTVVDFFYMHIKTFGLFFYFFLLSTKTGSVRSVLPEIKLVWPYWNISE